MPLRVNAPAFKKIHQKRLKNSRGCHVGNEEERALVVTLLTGNILLLMEMSLSEIGVLLVT
jgi:hypothetical protein